MRMLRHFVLSAVIIVPLALLATPSEAQAQIRIGPHVGYSFDVEQGFAGVDAWFGLTSVTDTIQLNLNPEFSYYFMPENVSLWSLDLNVPFLFGIPNLDILSPYAAAGLAVRRISFESDPGPFGSISASDTDIGFNLIGGALFMPDSMVNPFAQIKLTIADNTDFAIMGGAMFSF